MKLPSMLKLLNLFLLESLFGKPAKKEIHTTVGLGPGIMERRADFLKPEMGKYVVLDHRGELYEGESRSRAPDALDVAIFDNTNAANKGIKQAKKYYPQENYKVQEITEKFLTEYAHRQVKKK